jgi:rare lipoprotein A
MKFIYFPLICSFILVSLNGFSQNKNQNFEVGEASFYGKKWDGRRTSSGEILRSHKMTAAHRTLPFGTKVLVTNLENCSYVVVKINDRGPHIKKRIIDLSWGAAKELGIISAGLAKVEVAILE